MSQVSLVNVQVHVKSGPEVIKFSSCSSQEGAQWLSARVLDSRPRGCGFEPHWRHCVVPLSKNIYPSLVLVQPRKTCPFITERLLKGRKESNQTKQTNSSQVSTKFIMLINIKMPTIVGILTFISMINTTPESLKARKVFIFQYFSFHEQLKFHTQLS